MTVYKDCRNPVLPPSLHIPDPEAHVMPDGRVYIYGSLDTTTDTYCGPEYHVVSSANMVDWADHGVSFRAEQVPWLHDDKAPRYQNVDWDFENPSPFLANIMKEYMDKNGPVPPEDESHAPVSQHLFAPDAIYKDGRYYLYFCCSDNSEGIAVSEAPSGPFTNPVRVPHDGIDPAVFVDDDGQAYYYWGQFRASGAKLKSNMTELDEKSITPRLVTEEEHGFHEGSSLRKRGDTYYFVYPCIHRGNPTALAYATSKSPLGPYTYRGIIIDNKKCDPESWNIHGSIEEVNNQWYVFYHRSSVNSRYQRRLCIEPIKFNEDGSIDEVEMTSQGAGRPFALGESIEGWRACEVEGDVFTGEQTELHITGEGAAYFRYVEWPSPPQTVTIQAAGSGSIHVMVDCENTNTIEIDKEQTTAGLIGQNTGQHEIRLVFSKHSSFVLRSIVFE